MMEFALQDETIQPAVDQSLRVRRSLLGVSQQISNAHRVFTIPVELEQSLLDYDYSEFGDSTVITDYSESSDSTACPETMLSENH